MSKQLELSNQSIHDVVIPFTGERIIEMVTDTSIINVPVDSRIDISTIIADDDDPKFVNVEVIRARTSGNNRRYSNAVVNEINSMIPGVQAFFGHPDPAKYGFEFREPQGIFVGSIVEQMENGILRSIGKCYLFKTSPLREWVPKSIAACNPMTVSINGNADVIRNDIYLDVVHMTKLDSIDWANPGTEGIDTSQALSVVREQQQNLNLGGNKMAELSGAKDIIQNVTVAELRAYNPTGYEAVIKGTTVQELQSLNPIVVDQIKESAKITEMVLKIGGKEETIKVTELQGRLDAYEQKVTELQGTIAQGKLDAYKEKKVVELIPENIREMVSKRVTGKTEAEVDASIEAEMTYIREMGGNDNLPVGSQQKAPVDNAKDSVYLMFGNKPKQ